MPFDPSHPQPRVSVGILTRNAGKLFGRVIDALSKQTTDWPYELVILDSSSKDGTDKYAESRGVRVVPYRPAKFRFGTARDKLFESCRGEVIVVGVMQVKLLNSGGRMMQVKDAISLHGHDYRWKQLNDRFGSLAMGWGELGWPYALRGLLRDLIRPSRYVETASAFINRE